MQRQNRIDLFDFAPATSLVALAFSKGKTTSIFSSSLRPLASSFFRLLPVFISFSRPLAFSLPTKYNIDSKWRKEMFVAMDLLARCGLRCSSISRGQGRFANSRCCRDH